MFPRIPMKAKQAIAAFLQQDPEIDLVQGLEQAPGSLGDTNPFSGEEPAVNHLAVSAPEANAYEFQSGGIIDILEKLKDRFQQEKVDLESAELSTKHAYEILTQELHDSIENGKAEVGRRSKTLAQRREDLAGFQGDLADTTTERDADQKYLDDLTALCRVKAEDYENRQKLRSEEIAVLEEAIGVLSGEAGGVVDKHAEKYLPTLVQTRKRGVALVQLRSSAKMNPKQAEVAAFLEGRANALNSRLLAMMVTRVAADPFVKVKKMIKDLIVKLMEEATEEAEHKGWCDTELVTNQQTRDQLTAEVNELTAQVDELTALIAKLTQEIAELNAGIAEIDDAVAKATADREAEKAKNAQTVTDAQEAQTAVEQALSVLKEFYAKAAQATSLLQKQKQSPGADAPETFDEPYQGMAPGGGNAVDFLEVIQSDFARLESDTKAAEASAQEDYDKFMFDSRMDKAMKENDIKHKTEKKTQSESTLASAKKELDNTREELDAALAYYEKLKPTCVSTGISYEERVKRREAEIQSLQEALQILTGHDIPA